MEIVFLILLNGLSFFVLQPVLSADLNKTQTFSNYTLISCDERKSDIIIHPQVHIYKFESDEDYPMVKFHTCDSLVDTTLRIYNSNFTLINDDCYDDCGSCSYYDAPQEEISLPIVGGQDYYIAVGLGGWDAQDGFLTQIILNITCFNYSYEPTSAYPTVATPSPFPIHGQRGPNDFLPTAQPIGCNETVSNWAGSIPDSVEYIFTPETSWRDVTYSLCNSHYNSDTTLHIFGKYDNLLNINCFDNCGACAGKDHEEITLPAKKGYTYTINVGSAGFGSVDFNLSVICQNLPEEPESGFKGAEVGYIATSSSFVFAIVVALMIYCCWKKTIERKTMLVRNALVVLIGIDVYEDNKIIINPQINGFLPNLPGIDEDVKHMYELFHNELNYDVFPETIDEGIKTQWTESEIKTLLQDKARYLNNNLDRYDGLVVIMSCHGLSGYIATSDYQKFSKTAIHRIFSAAYPNIRFIPRLYIYDCCSGDGDRGGYRDDSDDESSQSVHGKSVKRDKKKTEAGKNVETEEIEAIWGYGEENPDYKLALVQASNEGYQSKVDSVKGSFVIHGFYQKMMAKLNKQCNASYFIYQIFDEIQNELTKAGKQLPTYTWNNNTRYIRFERNIARNKHIDGNEVEMKTDHQENKNAISENKLEDDKLEDNGNNESQIEMEKEHTFNQQNTEDSNKQQFSAE